MENTKLGGLFKFSVFGTKSSANYLNNQEKQQYIEYLESNFRGIKLSLIFWTTLISIIFIIILVCSLNSTHQNQDVYILSDQRKVSVKELEDAGGDVIFGYLFVDGKCLCKVLTEKQYQKYLLSNSLRRY